MNLLRAVLRLVVALFLFVIEYVNLFFRDSEDAAADKRRRDAILRDYFL